MNIKEYTHFNDEEIHSLYASAGWTAYSEEFNVLKQAFSHSLLILAAYEDGSLAGIIRIVGDEPTIIFIQDVLVSPKYPRRGIGTVLIREVLNRYSHVRQIELATDDTPKTFDFYKSLGFSQYQEIGCCGFMNIR